MAITKRASKLKCARGINEQLQKTSGADVLPPWKKKLRKTLGGWQPPPFPVSLVRPRVNPYSKGLPSIVLVDICDFQMGGRGRVYTSQVLETDEHKVKSIFAFRFHRRNSKRRRKKKKAEGGGGSG